jgi:hypothetical protein
MDIKNGRKARKVRIKVQPMASPAKNLTNPLKTCQDPKTFPAFIFHALIVRMKDLSKLPWDYNASGMRAMHWRQNSIDRTGRVLE